MVSYSEVHWPFKNDRYWTEHLRQIALNWLLEIGKLCINYTLAPGRFLCDVADSVLPELSAPNSCFCGLAERKCEISGEIKKNTNNKMFTRKKAQVKKIVWKDPKTEWLIVLKVMKWILWNSDITRSMINRLNCRIRENKSNANEVKNIWSALVNSVTANAFPWNSKIVLIHWISMDHHLFMSYAPSPFKYTRTICTIWKAKEEKKNKGKKP